VYLRFDSADGVARAIRDMVVRGAPAIGCAAAFGVAAEGLRSSGMSRADFDASLRTRVRRAQPRAGRRRSICSGRFEPDENGGCTARRFERAQVRPPSCLDEAQVMCREERRAQSRDGRARRGAARRALARAHHCNAGALATADTAPRSASCAQRSKAGKAVEVYADETRPFLQGASIDSVGASAGQDSGDAHSR